ncbi:MAG: MgtC/SapB family protein [Novosphingobium sp.]
MTDPLTLYPELLPIGLALALGLLVGVQRGWAQRHAIDGSRFAGVRTFGLTGLAGGFAGAFKTGEPVLSAIVLASSAGLILLGYWRATRDGPNVSGTASMVALLTLAAGYLAGSGEGVVASAAVGMMVLVLASREQLHGWVQSLDEREVMAIARFALIALVILPLLPSEAMGPYDAWKPRQLWAVVVMVSGFSFAGYLAAKHFGATRGVLATAAAGSAVSSTAVTASLAGKLRAGEGDAAINNAGTALASAVMFGRVMVLTYALAPMAFLSLCRFAVPGLVVSLIATWLILRKAKLDEGPGKGGADPSLKLRNPFDLGPALLLTALVMLLSLVARWVLANYGDAGLATVLAITGMVDVDSAIITIGNLPAGAIAASVAGLVLAPPIVLNTLIKAGMAVTMAGGRKGWPGAIALAVSAVAAIAGALTLL